MEAQTGDMTSAFSSALEGASAPPASEAPPASTPATASQTSETTPAAATAQPEAQAQTTEAAPAPEKPKGAPPEWRWQDILATQREKAAKEAEERVRQEYAWAQAIPAEQRTLVSEALRAYAQPTPQAPQAEQEPQPDLQAPDGTLVWSAPQLQKWQQWNEQRLMAQVLEKIQPLQQVAQTFQQREQQARAVSDVSQALTAFRAAHPDFEQHQADIRAAIEADPQLGQLADVNPAQALELAYARVFVSKVLPSQRQKTEAEVLATLQQTAVSSVVNPSAATASTPKKFGAGERGFAEALAHFGGTQ